MRGIYKDQVVLNMGFVVSTAAYDRIAADKTPAFVLITTDPGATVTTVRAGSSRRSARWPRCRRTRSSRTTSSAS